MTELEEKPAWGYFPESPCSRHLALYRAMGIG